MSHGNRNQNVGHLPGDADWREPSGRLLGLLPPQTLIRKVVVNPTPGYIGCMQLTGDIFHIYIFIYKMRTKFFARRLYTTINQKQQAKPNALDEITCLRNSYQPSKAASHRCTFYNDNHSWFLCFCLGLSSNHTWTRCSAKHGKWVTLANTKLLFIYHLLWEDFFKHTQTCICAYVYSDDRDLWESVEKHEHF